ncbi:DUF1566 domain-containing protein, partial [Vibrio vulnificus]|nr:DUF1566 domain-containing protein [Vibrio vulnificus]
VSSDVAIASVTPTGLLTGVEAGSTSLKASKNGVTSNTVNVTVCNDLAGACIDLFDTGGGKLFTNSPSVAYLDSIGGSSTNGSNHEIQTLGPSGDFYLFDWNNANALCATYSMNGIGGRTNWRLATKDELRMELFERYGSMFTTRSWPATYYYWSVTPDGSRYYVVHLGHDFITSNHSHPLIMNYASCVSEP